jgi:hypothetical protein
MGAALMHEENENRDVDGCGKSEFDAISTHRVYNILLDWYMQLSIYVPSQFLLMFTVH